MSYLPELRSSLVSAAERAGAAPISRPRRRWPRTGLRAIPVAIGVAVAIAVAVLALTAIRHAPTRVKPTSPAKQAPGREALLSVLGVLRRPQVPADLSGRVIQRFLRNRPPFGGGTVERGLIRRAMIAPWGSPIYVVPETPTGWTAYAPAPSSSTSTSVFTLKREGVDVEDAAGGGCCATASAITQYGDLSTEGAGRSFAGGSAQTRLVLLVPDGVAKVAFVLPRQVDRTDPTAPVYRRALTVTAAVRDNIVAVQVPHEIAGGRPAMIWYAPDGHVLKRLGNPAAASRVVSPPKPGPETPQSRAAEHDPSTPNRVWVGPAAGGPHANYMVHFRILLNEADYTFHISGTRCPGITVAGGQGGGTGNLRGRLFSGVLDAVHGQSWCRGTYHVSVTVTDLGRAGTLKHPVRPFGTATFTVRR
jgi:hypothetical protein